MSTNYRIFISHSWTYGDAYDRLMNLLNERGYFKFTDYSVPKDDPIHTRGSDTELYNAIKNQIQPCNVVLILAGIYASYSKWIDKEIQICKRGFSSPKPIIGIIPWGQERISDAVSSNADIMVKWNTESIIEAIRKHAI
jgi:hypothetical protein